MLRALARLFWAALPKRVRFAFAVEAPVVLHFHDYMSPRMGRFVSWMRDERDYAVRAVYGPAAIPFQEGDEDVIGWNIEPDGEVFRDEQTAFGALTAKLDADPKFVLALLERGELKPFESFDQLR